MIPAATVNLVTTSDEDYAQAFQMKVGEATGGEPIYYDFTDHSLMLMVRKRASDAEVFITLLSTELGVPVGSNGIDIYGPTGAENTFFDITISRQLLQSVPAGKYVQSLVSVRPDGLHDAIWRGTLTHSVGPTR